MIKQKKKIEPDGSLFFIPNYALYCIALRRERLSHTVRISDGQFANRPPGARTCQVRGGTADRIRIK